MADRDPKAFLIPFLSLLLVPPLFGSAGEASTGVTLEPTMEPVSTRDVALVVYDGVEILDFAGPAEVFEAANAFDVWEEPTFRLYTVGPSREPITSQKFLEVVPDFSVEDAPLPDLLVVPGGRTNPVVGNPAFLEWLGSAAEEAEVVMSVCSGAFVLGELGLLDDREATTWYAAVPGLARRFPEAKVRPGVRFVDSGAVLTTAGVSAGIDGALHLVARLHGRYVADRTARYMEYDWAPEAYLAREYPLFDPTLSPALRTLQLAEIRREEGDLRGAAGSYREAIEAGATGGRSWYGLGRTLQELGDPEGALEAYESVPGESDGYRYRALYNGACIAAGRGELDRGLDLLEASIDAGFRSWRWMSDDPALDPLRDDPRFAGLLRRLE